MLKLPGQLTASTFLTKYWQKKPLVMPQALIRRKAAITRNELAWLATLEDVESRIVFVDRRDDFCRYRVEHGPFDADFLSSLPKRDWTLLVHDVEKHLPDMRKLFDNVSFVPDWRIDDLMVSFAAPGGGVGPHKDNYDVFLCQGIGIREWQISTAEIADNPAASNDLALLQAFSGQKIDARAGDVLYLPPGVAHWGAAERACMTYSIGMRAPLASEIAGAMNSAMPDTDAFYTDPDLRVDEAAPGLITDASAKRARRLLNLHETCSAEVADSLGRCATQPKSGLQPCGTSEQQTKKTMAAFTAGARMRIHGMARIAFDTENIYLNGHSRSLPTGAGKFLSGLCERRETRKEKTVGEQFPELIAWMLEHGAFETTDDP